MRCTVIGAGVIGLSCAVRLREAGHAVRIVARALPPRTTSSVAAAFWYPYHAAPAHRVVPWARVSHETYGRLQAMAHTGIRFRTLIDVQARAADPPAWAMDIAGFRAARADELPPGCVAAWACPVPVVDTRRYMPWLLDRARALGCAIETRELPNLYRALDGADAVINCSGLGAGRLVPDPAVSPIRGQLVLVPNPGVDDAVVDETRAGEITYVIPREDDVVLGGTTAPGVDDIAADDADTADVLRRCRRLVPALEGVDPLAVVVGLRPGRTEVRLEREELDGVPVIHNYGHGGAGVTLSWGCAAEVVGLLHGPARS